MDQLSIITQMFENLSDHEKSEFLKYLKADKTNQEIKSSDLFIGLSKANKKPRTKSGRCI